MQIHGFQKTTLLDYPKHLASTLFTGACNFRCPFCQNASLVLSPNVQPVIPTEEILSDLRRRAGILEGVCITGGEPTLQPDLADFIREIRTLHLSVKLDTNGYRPDILKQLLDDHLVDYVAMDIKSSPKRYAFAAGLSTLSFERIAESASLLIKTGNTQTAFTYEFRTTAVRELITPQDFQAIGQWLSGAKAYYLQGFQDSGDLIAPNGLSGYSYEELEQIRTTLLPFFDTVSIRGIDPTPNASPARKGAI